MKRVLSRLACVTLAAWAPVLMSASASADPIFWVEPGDQDLSGGGDLRVFNLDLGTNTIMGTTIYGGFPLIVDFDSFAFVVPPDTHVTAASVQVYTAQNQYYNLGWWLNTGLIVFNGQTLQTLNCQFASGQNNVATYTINVPFGPGAFNISNFNLNAELNSVAVWRFDFTVSPLNATGACCNGNTCAVVPSAQCTTGYQGNFTTCGPVTCCEAPITFASTLPPITRDCDGDLVQDTCTTQNDCNANGAADSCETLVFSDDDFTLGTNFNWQGSATGRQPEGYVQLTDAVSQGGTMARPPVTTGVTKRMRAMFDFQINPFGNPAADGIAFSLLDADVFNTDVIFGEEGVNAPNVLTVKFNTYENYPGEGSNSMFIRYGGVNIAQNASLPFTLADAQWRRAIIDLTPDGRITVRVGSAPGNVTTIFNNVQIPGYVPKRSIIAIGARTGGFYAVQNIDNVRIGVNGPNDLNADAVPDSCSCRANFNGVNGLSVQDIFDFLAAFFQGLPAANFNGVNGITVQDIFDFLAAYFAGCP